MNRISSLEAAREIRLAGRRLTRRPGFTAAAVLTLALGIGASVAIFAVVDAVLLRPLDYPDSDRIVTVDHHAPGLNLPDITNSEGTVRFYREEAPFLSAFAGYEVESTNLLVGGNPFYATTARVTPNLFSVLRVQPALGRPFSASDADEGAAPVAILSHAEWASQFGSDPGVVGRKVLVDGRSTEIVGVMPRGVGFPDASTALLRPLRIDPDGGFETFGIRGIARLAPGVTLTEAQRRIAALQGRMPDYFHEKDLTAAFFEKAGWSASLRPLRETIVGDVAPALWIIFGTVGLLLLIACANVANLFLVRSDARLEEVSIRAALGAGRSRLALLFLSEALLLGVAGGALGVALAEGGLRLLLVLGPGTLPRLHDVALDGRVLAVAALLSVLAGLGFGSLPLVRIPGRGPAVPLREGARGSTGTRERHRARSGMVAGQLALALVLLVGAGLMVRTFQRLRSVDVGFDPRNVLAVGMSVGASASPTEAARVYQRVADRVAALPGVERAGISTFVPLGRGTYNGGSLEVQGQPTESGALPPVALYKAVGPGYFETMGMTLERGRSEQPSDWQDGVPVVWVNETFARTILGGHALDRRVRWGRGTDTTWARVVGVVKDVHEFSLMRPIRPMAYLPLVVGHWGYPNLSVAYLMVKARRDPTAIVPPIRAILHGVNATVPITETLTMAAVESRAMERTSFTVVLLGIAALVALFLSAVGLFGVVSYAVSRRTREIGIRMALGADGRAIRGMVLRQSAVVAALGAGAGLLGALGLTRLMDSVVFGVSTTDPISFLVAPVVLLAIVALASWLPARRASSVDPMTALRTE